MKARKKPVMSGSRTEQIQRELDRVALDLRHALGAATEVGLARQRVAQRLDPQRLDRGPIHHGLYAVRRAL